MEFWFLDDDVVGAVLGIDFVPSGVGVFGFPVGCYGVCDAGWDVIGEC